MALYISNGKLKCIKFASNVWYIENLYVPLHRETSVAGLRSGIE